MKIFDLATIRAEALVPLITIYKNPKDFPDQYVARLFDIGRPTGRFFAADTYEEVLKEIPTRGMVRIPRRPNDDPVIVEVWM